jgi:hypothetical protein
METSPWIDWPAGKWVTYVACMWIIYNISWPNLAFMPRRLKSGYSSGWSKRLKAICQLSANHWGKQTLCFHLMLTNISSIHQIQDMHRDNMDAHYVFFTQIQLLTSSYLFNKLAKVDHESWYMLQCVVIMYTPLYFVILITYVPHKAVAEVSE